MQKPIKELSRTLRIPLSRRLAFRRLRQYHARARTLEETVDWAMHFGRYGYFTIHTLQRRSEIIALARAVAARRRRTILEIGTARGGTLLIWASLATERVISCDLVHRPAQKPLPEALPPRGSGCRVRLLTGDSHDPAFRARVAAELAGVPVDFLFIDGDHSESGVARDFGDYQSLVRPGGIVAFHDIVENPPRPGNQVHYFWQRLKQDGANEGFIEDPRQCGFGIGILRVPE